MGYGPGSPFWHQYIDTLGNALYSIALLPVSSKNQALEGDTPFYTESQVTFGSPGDYNSYAKQPHSSPTATLDAQNQFTYEATTFGFGLVYSSDSTQYFQNFTDLSPITFTPSFQGLGLPSAMYDQYTTLVVNASQNAAVCGTGVGGVCYLPASCSAYQGHNLLDYSFQIFFPDQTNYIRVPLATFLVDLPNVGCQVAVENLSAENDSSENVVFGSMFFSNFYSVF